MSAAQPYVDLARQILRKINGVHVEDGGDMEVPCPLEGHTTYIVSAAGPEGEAMWCSGECDPQQVEAALRSLVSDLPDLCQDPRRHDFGHRDTCSVCLNYAAAARTAFPRARALFRDAGAADVEEERRKGLARLVGGRLARRDYAALQTAEFDRAASTEATPEEVEALLGRFTLLTASDVRHRPTVPDIVDGIIGPPGTINQMDGPRGSMKSLLTLGLAGAVATDAPSVYGLPVNQHGAVLYAYLEGVSGLPRRLNAWETYHGRSMDDVTFSHDPLDMKQPEDVGALAVAARRLGALVIVLDSVAKTGGGREDVEDFGLYRAGLESLRDATDVAVLVLHNTGHDQSRGRGHTTLIDGMDSAVLLRREPQSLGGGIRVSDEKARDTEALADLRVRFEPCGPLNPKKGEPWSGVVVRQDDGETVSNALTAVSGQIAQVLDAIDRAGGEIAPGDLAVVLNVDPNRLGRTLRPLIEAKIVTDNGKGTRAKRYVRGPEADDA